MSRVVARLLVGCVVALLMPAASALAQPVPPAVAPPAQATPTEATPPSAAARAQLDLGRKYLKEGKKEAAREVLSSVVEEFKTGPEVEEAKKLLAALGATASDAERPDPDEGRAIFVAGTAMSWVTIGMVAPLMWLDDNDGRGYLRQFYWSALGFGTVAGVAAYLATKDVPVKRGYAQLATASQLIGMTDGFLIAALVQGEDMDRHVTVPATAFGAAAGLVAAIVHKDTMTVRPGRASFIAGSWMMGMLFGEYVAMSAFDEDLTLRQGLGAPLAGGTIALAAAAKWGPAWTTTRVGYVTLVWAGGYLLSYALLANKIEDHSLTVRNAGVTLLLCQAGALALGTWLTSGMADDTAEAGDARPLIAPSLVSFDGGQARVAIPLPRIGLIPNGSSASPHIAIDLLAGQW